ncbi:MAG: chemotaxis protein CheW [Candidatus Moduliflexus flocculans]|nr:chemotaxis protein CheW [Candidatus Moduliflexus flocculans]
MNVSRVEVVLEMQNVTRVPKAPPHMRGVINHRGSVVPVVDLRLRFGMGPSELKEGTSIIILQIDHGGGLLTVGMLADGVREVVDLDPSNTEKPPRLGRRLDDAVIEGIAKRGDEFVILPEHRPGFPDGGPRSPASAGHGQVTEGNGRRSRHRHRRGRVHRRPGHPEIPGGETDTP